MTDPQGFYLRVAAAFSLRKNLALLVAPRADQIPTIAGLRALSILWVLLAHVQQGLLPLRSTPDGAAFLAGPLLRLGWAGNLGVDIFFVISGYLIGGMLMQEQEARGRISFREFYRRRAMRILPAYLVAVAANLALGSPNPDKAWTNLVFLNNFVPFVRQFMAHTWSLAIEEQFYLLFPLWLLAMYRLPLRVRTQWITGTVLVFAGIAVALVLHYNLEVSLARPNITEFWRYMDQFYVKPYARFGELFLGVLVVHLERTSRIIEALEKRPAVASTVGLVALLIMAVITFVFPEPRSPSGAKLLLGSLALALNNTLFAAAVGYIILLSQTKSRAGRALARPLGARVLHPLAQLSYAAYLFHPICIAPLLPRIGFDLGSPYFSFARSVSLSLLSSFALAALVHLLVERPIMNLRAAQT